MLTRMEWFLVFILLSIGFLITDGKYDTASTLLLYGAGIAGGTFLSRYLIKTEVAQDWIWGRDRMKDDPTWSPDGDGNGPLV